MYMQHYSAQLQQVLPIPLNKGSWRRGQASQKNSSRVILKIKEHDNGVPIYEKTGATINQRKNSNADL